MSVQTLGDSSSIKTPPEKSFRSAYRRANTSVCLAVSWASQNCHRLERKPIGRTFPRAVKCYERRLLRVQFCRALESVPTYLSISAVFPYDRPPFFNKNGSSACPRYDRAIELIGQTMAQLPSFVALVDLVRVPLRWSEDGHWSVGTGFQSR